MKPSTLVLALAGLSFMMTVIWGGPLLRILRHFKMGKIIRIEEPSGHFNKMGTPTMGGIMIIVPVAMLTILLNAVSMIGLNIFGSSLLVPLFAMLTFGLLGIVDDWLGLYGKRKGEGMRSRTKFIVQIILAVSLAIIIRYGLDAPEIYLPGIPGEISLGIWYVPIATIIIAGMSNAVNFTDGLDGLAGLISATAFAAFGGLALMQGQIFLARFCFIMVGALFGFLWFNVHPAELIMGDTGSLSLGATLAVVALMTGHWILLPFIAIIPVSELLSVIIQVSYFKITKGRRFFKMTPIHLHYELSGWSETQIVQRFWLIGLLSAMLGIGLAMV
ncbi:MAG: phospho-N-acetylmuramoyl-pentapeptide-transferase [Chloroflexota bacterium]